MNNICVFFFSLFVYKQNLFFFFRENEFSHMFTLSSFFCSVYLFIVINICSFFIVLVMPSHQPAKSPRYSSTYEDDMYQYRHVIVDKGMVSLIPKNRLMDECEWRALGVKQGAHWEHYLIHKPGETIVRLNILMEECLFRTVCSDVSSFIEIST